jgi:hypothetical protein
LNSTGILIIGLLAAFDWSGRVMCVAVSDDCEHFVHYWLCLLQTSPGALPVLKKTTSASSVLMFPSLPEYPGPGASTSGEPAVKLPSPSWGLNRLQFAHNVLAVVQAFLWIQSSLYVNSCLIHDIGNVRSSGFGWSRDLFLQIPQSPGLRRRQAQDTTDGNALEVQAQPRRL